MVVVYGGKDREGRLGDLFSLDTATHTWTELKPLGNAPPPRSLHSAVLISNNRMIILGGMVPKNEGVNKLEPGDDPAGKSVWKSEDKV